MVDTSNAAENETVFEGLRSINEFDEVHVGGVSRLSVFATGRYFYGHVLQNHLKYWHQAIVIRRIPSGVQIYLADYLPI